MGEVVHMPERNGEPFVSKRQLATHLGVTTRTIDRWLGLPDGGVPHVKLGQSAQSHVRFKISEVEEWLGRRAS